MEQDLILQSLIARAATLGAEAVEVEDKDCCEEVVAMRGPLGVGIASFRSSDSRATALRKERYRLAKRRATVVGGDVRYAVRVQVHESFGEDAFRVEFSKAAAGPNISRFGKAEPHEKIVSR